MAMQTGRSCLKNQCRELLAAKQDLIDEVRTIVVGNRSMLQRLQVSTDIPVTNDSEDLAYASFNQVIEEWTTRVKSKEDFEVIWSR